MPQVISTNSLSLSTQNNLNKSQQSLNTAIERLSSGQRINSARDDAAGLAISNRMNAQIEGLTQANRNANDGISVAQTAEGALSQVTDNLTRIRELTVQAQNGTLSDTDKASIQEEIDQRLEEINRLSTDTQFNGKTLLDGSSNSIKIQVGANDGQTIELSMTDISTASLDVDGFSVSGAIGTNDLSTDASLTESDGTTTVANPTSFTVGGETVTGELKQYTDSDGNDQYAVKVGDKYYSATVSVTDSVEDDTATAGVDESADAVVNVTVGAELNVVEGDSVEATADPLATLDKALAAVDSARSTLGAQQNRLQSTIEGNATTSTNLSSAKSQITDADYATEVSNMTTAKILQQAGTSVLAQANQVPQNVLSLLQ